MEIKFINPTELFNRNRLDLIVKYLFAQEILERENNLYTKDTYKDLYIRHILMRTKGITSPLEINLKNSIDEYCIEFEKLINEIKSNGYNQEYPVEISNDGLIANGAHRIAACTALKKDIAVIKNNNGHSWDFNWFCQNGFNTEDKQRILKGFVEIHSDKCALFVVWNPLFKYIDNVKAVINTYFDIVGDVELDFENNYIAFTNILLEIYERNIVQNNNDESGIRAKANLLQANYLSFKVIVATNQEKNSNTPVSELSKNCKDEIRNLFNHLLPKECFCTVHSSDNKDECKYLANILLSPNNITHLKMRISSHSCPDFISKIRNLPVFLQSKEINSNEVCVIGTGVMSALGIQEEYKSDIDFIIDHKYRDKFGWGAYHLSDDYEIGVSSKQANGPIHDNIIIYNDDYHFWFKGIKFANLEIIKERKSSFAREKDKIHYRQIELFEKMIGNFNQQKMLMERIEAEKQRRITLRQQHQDKKVHYSHMIERIFSVKNEYYNNKKYKIVTIAGIKIKRRKHA